MGWKETNHKTILNTKQPNKCQEPTSLPQSGIPGHKETQAQHSVLGRNLTLQFFSGGPLRFPCQ